jgi:hypothetical protein
VRTLDPLRPALAAALCAHAAATWAFMLVPKGTPLALPALPRPEELFFISDEPPRASSSAVGESAPPAAARANVAVSRGPVPVRSSPELPGSAVVGAAEEAPAVPAPVDNVEHQSSPAGAAPVDLGIGSLWRSVALDGASRARGDSSREIAPPATDRVFRDAADSRDHDLGLGSSGPLVAAAHEAGSMPSAPDTGTATFEVESDATGKVTTANVVSVSADAAGWNAVGRELVSLMDSRRLHLPSGARGLRTRLRITAERTLPSGTKGTTSLGAVPDDVPGGGSVCVGEGWLRKCTKGMPVGVTRNATDVANFGASVSRIVRAKILEEKTL